MADYTESDPDATVLYDVNSEDIMAIGDKLKLISKDSFKDQVANGHPTSEVRPVQFAEQQKEDSKISTKQTRERLKVIIPSFISFAVAVIIALAITTFFEPPQVIPHGAVVSRHTLCSDIGVDILQNEGSAVDAAIATTLCVGVVNPASTGIGGGGMMIIRNHQENSTIVIDAREAAPRKAERQMFLKHPVDSIKGARAVAVPGLLRGLEMAHQKYGKLAWKDIIKPAADLARNGFNVSKHLVNSIKEKRLKLTDSDGGNLTKIFLPDGRPLKPGDWLRLPALADTLDAIAEEGVGVMYEGHIAQEIQQLMIENGGLIDLDDLKNYSAVVRKPISIIFKNTTIETVPPPGSGPLVLLILNILQNYSVSAQNLTTAHVNLTYHRLLEALKLASAERTKLCDSGFNPNVENITKRMISSEFAANLRKLIDDNATHPADYYGSHKKGSVDHGTSHVSVAGPSGDFVAISSSLNWEFGSQLMTPSGIILNNQMNGFDVENTGEQMNFIEGGKRPLSGMSPTIVYTTEKGCAPCLALGGTNGTRIYSVANISFDIKLLWEEYIRSLKFENWSKSGVAEVLLNMFGFGMNVSDAIAAPRIYTSYDEDDEDDERVLLYDNDFDQLVLSSLVSKGHPNPTDQYSGVNNVNAVMKMDETISGYCDPRNAGKPAVY